MAALGDTEKAENMLDSMARKSKTTFRWIFSPVFRTFKNHVLDYQWPTFITGLYEKNIKHDNAKALEYFRKIKNPPPAVLLEIAESLYL